MRMRFKPYARPELLATDWHAHEPLDNKGRWRSLFAPPGQHLPLELGCGKGGYLAQLSSAHPEVNYLGVDITDKVLILAKRKIEKAYAEKGMPVDNVLIASFDIERIANVMDERDEVQRIYINFCNPWPKPKHWKKRLTHPRQLMNYRAFLKDGGEIRFKTDDADLFESSLGYFRQCGFTVTFLTRDLHAETGVDNIETEHERMFSAEGVPIKALYARKEPSPL